MPPLFATAADGKVNYGSIDVGIQQRLNNSRFLSDDSHLDTGFVRIHSDSVQHHHGREPESSSDTLDADGFAAQRRQRIDFLAHHQLPRNSPDRKSDTADLRPCRNTAEDIANRRYEHRYFPGHQSR